MEADPSLLSFNVALGVLLVDILLSGDNAIVIALVCRSLSVEHRTKALWLGILGAFFARLVLTSVATLAMHMPLIKLVGGILLLKISIDLIVDNVSQQGHDPDQGPSSAQDIFSAARTIVLADIVMSLDNVVALSAITQNNFQMLVAGLLLSVPILMFGSLYISRLLDGFPWLLWVGGAILGGVSGALIIDDPIFDGAFNNPSSLANLAVPALAAWFVVQISKVIAANAQAMQGVERPRSIFAILRFGAAPATDAAQAARSTIPALPQLATPEPELPRPPAVVELPAPPLAAPVDATAFVPAPKPVVAYVEPTGGGEHRVVMAIGLFMMLTGGAVYYMVNAYEPAVPDRFITYTCKEPAMAISFRPSAQEIRFANAKAVVVTSVIDDRIIWEDYRDAGAKLSVPPPVKIVSADVGKLVVNGGMFENTTCLAPAR